MDGEASGSPGLHKGPLSPACTLSTGCKLNRLNSVVGEYAGACLQVAHDCGIDVLDLWTLMQKDTQVPGLARSSGGVGSHRRDPAVCGSE